MSKFNINMTVELHPFKTALGDLFPKICNDAKAFVGRLETENNGKAVVAKLSGVDVTAKLVLKSKEGYSMQMPPNNPMSFLIAFGRNLSKMDDNMGLRKVENGVVVASGIESDVPEKCQDWINQQRNSAKSTTVPAVAK